MNIYHSGDFQQETKVDNSPLTRAKASHEIIASYLRE